MRASRSLHTALFAALALGGFVIGSASAPARAQAAAIQTPQHALSVSASKGTLVRLDRPAASVFIADPKIADVQVRSPHLVYVLGVGAGETTLYAMDSADRVIYS
ncbi:MAG TPA: pilus assembly protein N-terminal domain-containing protein, partial [Pedomonas sp.]|nr:pilus assembly protein N-terminal domain-containing protein [Pedomonas sp.]